jgi:uncharacterized protein YjbI with pentapeptide repeats
MDDSTRAALDSEAPVNPYSLLDAVNWAAARTNRAWLLFLALMAYMALAVGSLTHRDLLLDSGIVLPLLQVRLELSRFFIIAPMAVALLHVMLVAQHAVLARKTLEFDAALRLLESTDRRSHPLRLNLDSSFFVQALAGPERSRVIAAMLNGIAWLSLLILPLLLLLYMQVAFLPFHDAAVTTVQRTVVLAEVMLLLLAGVFLMRAETSFFGAVLRFGLNNPGSAAFGLVVLAAAATMSILAAIPAGTARESGNGALFGLFARNLDVGDASLVPEKGEKAKERSLNLRGRDLRFARLDRAELPQADLTGATLDGASLRGADLRGARLGCAEPTALKQPDGRQKAGCTSARGADFSAAWLDGAKLAGADLRGARFDEALAKGVDLSRGLAIGATFERASLDLADLSGAALEGASFVRARLPGGILTGARLQMADFTQAGLEGASLTSAQLGGAVLRGANLEGAELRQARLYGADMRGARMVAADLAGAAVWRTVPPAGDAAALADFANIALKAPGKDEVEALTALAASIDATLPAGERTAGLDGLVKDVGEGGWMNSADGQTWAGLLRSSEAAMADGFSSRLAEHLARMICRDRSTGSAVAMGVAARIVLPAFKGDPAVVADRLKAADCPAARNLPVLAMQKPGAAAEGAKGQ